MIPWCDLAETPGGQGDSTGARMQGPATTAMLSLLRMCLMRCEQAPAAGRKTSITDPASTGWQTGLWKTPCDPPALHGPHHEYSGSGGGTLLRHHRAATRAAGSSARAGTGQGGKGGGGGGTGADGDDSWQPMCNSAKDRRAAPSASSRPLSAGQHLRYLEGSMGQVPVASGGCGPSDSRGYECRFV